MEDCLVREKAAKNYRIKVYYDQDAEYPRKNFDLMPEFLFTDDRGNPGSLSDWEEYSYECPRTMEEALWRIILDKVPYSKFNSYLKKKDNSTGVYAEYDRHERLWHIKPKDKRNYFCEEEYDSEEFNYGKAIDDCEDFLSEEDMFNLLNDCCKDLTLVPFSSRGYSQGDYSEGYAIVTKKLYEDWGFKAGKNWRADAAGKAQADIDTLSKWMWGDVYGYTLEQKTRKAGRKRLLAGASTWTLTTS